MRSDRVTDDAMKPVRLGRSVGASRPEVAPAADRLAQSVIVLGPREAARRILAYRKMAESGRRILFGEVHAPRWQPSEAEIDAELDELRRMRGCHRAYQQRYDARRAAEGDGAGDGAGDDD